MGLLSVNVLAQSRHLNRPSQLDTRNLVHSDVYQLIYLGQFDELRKRHGWPKDFLQLTFTHSAIAWSKLCPQQVAAGSPSFAVLFEKTNGWGSVTRTERVDHRIDKRFVEKIQQWGITFSYSPDIEELFTRNGCTSPGTQRYLDNLLRFAYDKPSVQSQPAATR